MEKGNQITFTRKTFKFGNSQAITIPQSLNVPMKAKLKITVEMIETPDEPASE